MLANATSISNVKVPLHQIVKASLENETIFATNKQKVINLMQNWENGAILNDNVIKNRFMEFYNLDEIEDVDDFIQLLNDNDDWFELMFKNTDL